MNFSSDPINTLENLIYKNKTKSISIYLVLVLALIVGLFLLSVINIDISSQSGGIICFDANIIAIKSQAKLKQKKYMEVLTSVQVYCTELCSLCCDKKVLEKHILLQRLINI